MKIDKEKPSEKALEIARVLIKQWDELTYKAVGRHHILPRTTYKKASPEEQAKAVAALIDQKLSEVREAFEQAFDEQTLCRNPPKEGCLHTGCKLMAEVYTTLAVSPPEKGKETK